LPNFSSKEALDKGSLKNRMHVLFFHELEYTGAVEWRAE
jgi:hypothetical protein